MNRLLLALCCGTLCSLSNISMAESPTSKKPSATSAVSIEVTGLSVSKNNSLGSSLAAFGTQGTNLMIRISSDQDQFYAVDIEGSQIIKFSDNSDTNLIEAGIKADEQWKKDNPNTFAFSTIITNGISNANCEGEKKACFITFNSTALPNPSAAQLNLNAKITLLSAGEKKEKSIENIQLVSGNKIDIAPYTLTLEDGGIMSYGATQYKLFKISGLHINSISLYDNQGNPIDATFSQEQLSVNMASLNNQQPINAKISYAVPVKTTVPINLFTSVGLQNSAK